MITGIAHVALTVSSMKRSIDFYTRALGFTRAFDLLDDKGNIKLTYLRVGRSQFIEIFPGDPTLVVKSRTGHVCFEVDDLPATVEAMRAQGVEILVEPKMGRDGCRQAWIADPDGYRIELMQIMPNSLQAKAIERSNE